MKKLRTQEKKTLNIDERGENIRLDLDLCSASNSCMCGCMCACCKRWRMGECLLNVKLYTPEPPGYAVMFF